MAHIEPYLQNSVQVCGTRVTGCHEGKMLQRDRRNPPKIGGKDKTIQTDKQRDAILQKMVVRIEHYNHYKQTDAIL